MWKWRQSALESRGSKYQKKSHFFFPLCFGLRMVRMESLQVLKPIFESIWGSKFDFRHQKKLKKKLSNAFKTLQNESLKVLNQCLETIYEYKSYFCIFSFFTFCSYFPGIPRRSHCVSPLCLPVVFPRFGSKSFSMFLLLSMMSFLDFPCVFAGFWSYQWYIYIYSLDHKHKQNKVQ